MTSSNKVRRYLEHHKHPTTESCDSQNSTSHLFIGSSRLSSATMRKFRGKNQQQYFLTRTSIPRIYVNNNHEENNISDNDGNGHMAILDKFDQVLEDELKHTSVSRSLSLKQDETIEHMEIPANQSRSLSFALDSKTNLNEEKLDNKNNNDKSMNKLSSTSLISSKSSLSRDTFSRLFQSLTLRSGNLSTSKMSLTRTDSQYQQYPCLACQNYPNFDLMTKNKKRPSIFGVLVSKLNNVSTTNEKTFKHCSVCKRPLSKTVSANSNDYQQLSSINYLRNQKQLSSRTKRRQSLPSLSDNLLESSSAQQQPSCPSVLNHLVLDNITNEQQQLSTLSQSSTSLTEPTDSIYNTSTYSHSNSSRQGQGNNYDDPFQLTEKVSQLSKLRFIISHENSLALSGTHASNIHTHMHRSRQGERERERERERRSSVNAPGFKNKKGQFIIM